MQSIAIQFGGKEIIMVKKINEVEFRNEALKGVSVVDFSATWCGPCKMLAPVIEAVSDEMDNVSFYNVDIDENEKLADEYGIVSVPSVLVFKDGEKKGMLIGFKQKDVLKSELQKYCN